MWINWKFSALYSFTHTVCYCQKLTPKQILDTIQGVTCRRTIHFDRQRTLRENPYLLRFPTSYTGKHYLKCSIEACCYKSVCVCLCVLFFYFETLEVELVSCFENRSFLPMEDVLCPLEIVLLLLALFLFLIVCVCVCLCVNIPSVLSGLLSHLYIPQSHRNPLSWSAQEGNN